MLQEISEIKGSMNSKRTKYEEPLTHKIHITDNWLLGFIEGDGSFSITKKDFILTFSRPPLHSYAAGVRRLVKKVIYL